MTCVTASVPPVVLHNRYGASSAAVSTTVVALGTWGALNPPQVVSAVATTHGNQAGMGPADRIVVTFDSDTDRAGYANTQISKANVDKLLTFTFGGDPVSLGTSYVPVVEVLRVVCAGMAPTMRACAWVGQVRGHVGVGQQASDHAGRHHRRVVTAADPCWGHACRSCHWQQHQELRRHVRRSDGTCASVVVGAWSARLTSGHRCGTLVTRQGSATLSGDWGAQAAPTISSMVAANAVAPFTPTPGISIGDTVTITFNAATNMPPVGSKADISTWLSFTGNMGSAYVLGPGPPPPLGARHPHAMCGVLPLSTQVLWRVAE